MKIMKIYIQGKYVKKVQDKERITAGGKSQISTIQYLHGRNQEKMLKIHLQNVNIFKYPGK